MIAKTQQSPSCFSCASNVPGKARFCPGCGVAVEDTVMMLDVEDSGQHHDSQGVGATPTGRRRRYSSQQRASDSRPNWAAVVLGGVAVVGLAVWLLARAPVTTLDGVSEALVPETNEGGGSDTQGLDLPSDFIDFELVDPDSGGPLLGEELGLDLYVSRGSGLGRINLDTGETTMFIVEGQPIAVRGDELLLLSNQRVLAADLDDPEGPTRLIYDLPVNSSAEVFELVLVGENRLVLSVEEFTADRIRQTVTVVDLESGDSDTIDLSPLSSSQLGLIWTPGGGTFDFVQGEFVKVFDGLVLSAGPETGLGFRCDQPSDCRYQRFDRRTGEILEAELPPFDRPSELIQVSGSDRFVMVGAIEFDDEGQGLRLFDTATGEFPPGGLAPTLSPSGPLDDSQLLAAWEDRLVAFRAGSTIRIQDVTADAGWIVPLDRIGEGSIGRPQRLFLVPR